MENEKEIREIEVEKIFKDEKQRIIVRYLMNKIETLVKKNKVLEEENQKLKEEIARLNGHKPKPEIKPSKKENFLQKEKLQIKNNDDSPKINKEKKIEITNHVRIEVGRKCKCGNADKNMFYSKGKRKVIIQDIKILPNNTVYELEKMECQKCGKIIEANLPNEIKGRYGNALKTWLSYFRYEMRIPENKLHKFFEEVGIVISEGEISKILIENGNKLTEEVKLIKKAGLENSKYVNMDETGWKNCGDNNYLWYVGNEKFNIYEIHDKRNGDIAKKVLGIENGEKKDIIVVHDDFSGYNALDNYILASALCFIHEIRHFEKITPFFEEHRKLLDEKIKGLWEIYDELKRYRVNPNFDQKKLIEQKFDNLLTKKTEYEELEHRMKLTYNKKDKLLLYLEYPDVPPENNSAERALRHGVIMRKIIGGTRSEEGKLSLVNHLSIFGTCKKLGISIKNYLYSVISGINLEKRLADYIIPPAHAPT